MSKSQLNPLPKLEVQDVDFSSSIPRRPSWTSKLALFFGSLVITLLLLEGFVRFLTPALAPQPWLDRPEWWYVPESSHDERNALFTEAKEPGSFRIVSIGDSFSFAGKVQYDDGYSKRLERMLNLNDHQRKVEVLNWGIPGYSTVQEERLVKRAMSEFSADLVVLQITLNDPERQPYRSSHAWLYRWDKNVETWKIFQYWKTAQFFAQRILNSVHTREYLAYHKSLYADPETWNIFAAALGHIKHDSDATKVPVVAMLFPMFSHPFDKRYPFAEEHEKIRARLAELGIPFLDLFPFYHDIPPERLQAMPGKDSHPNEIAHRIASEALYTFLKDRNLLPEDALIKKVESEGRHLPHAVVRGDKVGSGKE